jgi:hypothetical protein
VEKPYVQNGSLQPRRQVDIGDNLWLEVSHPFIAVKSLYISREFVRRIADAMQMLLGESVAEALPALQTLFPDEPRSVQENIAQFVVARQLVVHSIAALQKLFLVRS